jgi:hypothetical protein
MRIAYYIGGHLDNFISELDRSWKDHTERLPTFSESELFGVNSWSPDGNWLATPGQKKSGKNDQLALPYILLRQNDLISSQILDGPRLAGRQPQVALSVSRQIMSSSQRPQKVREMFSVSPTPFLSQP